MKTELRLVKNKLEGATITYNIRYMLDEGLERVCNPTFMTIGAVAKIGRKWNVGKTKQFKTLNEAVNYLVDKFENN